jgi:hypothetical protein
VTRAAGEKSVGCVYCAYPKWCETKHNKRLVIDETYTLRSTHLLIIHIILDVDIVGLLKTAKST